MGIWLDNVREAAVAGEPSVVVTMAAVRGSAPREAGAAMVVTPRRVAGTIGGGNLEFMAIERAREVLDRRLQLPDAGEVVRYPLDTSLGQCCGGVAFLHYELLPASLPAWVETLAALHDAGEPALALSRPGCGVTLRTIVTANGVVGDEADDTTLRAAVSVAASTIESRGQDLQLLWSPTGEKPSASNLGGFVFMRPALVGDFRVLLFGAGHVGRALVHVLGPLADRVVWSDGREGEFPTDPPANTRLELGDPFALIESSPAGTFYLVMTHSHSLDLALCEAILQRGDFCYLGLIGSLPKRRRFEKHLREEGYSNADLERLICPIGVEGIRSKEPAAIAVSVAAQLLRVREASGLV